MIVTFGEILLRLSPPGYQRFAQASSFDAYYGGAEFNTAVSLAHLGEPTRHVTCLPANELGETCVGTLARWNVDTSAVVMDMSLDARMGLYFCERGASQRASRVIYDRQYSSFSRIKRGTFQWKQILHDADWFHFTGITPALSDEAAETALEACHTAKKLGIGVSLDLNYRASLWPREKAGCTLRRYLSSIDVLFANNGSLYDVFGLDVSGSAYRNGPEETLAAARETAERFGIGRVALTMRHSVSASRNEWAALLWDGREKKAFLSRRYVMDMVDRIGGGDSFAAGLLYAWRQQFPNAKAIEFAAASSCLKQTIPGDVNLISRKEVENLMASDGNALIQR